jgi:hypothetical protein
MYRSFQKLYTLYHTTESRAKRGTFPIAETRRVLNSLHASPQDLRERVLRAVDQGVPHQEIVHVLGTIGWHLKQRREIGHVRPKTIPGRLAVKGAMLRVHLRVQLEADEHDSQGTS